MAVRMVALVRSKNGEYVARKGIPADVREAPRTAFSFFCHDERQHG